MPEFKIRVGWYKKDKQQIWNDKKPQEYHRFSVVNYHDLPSKYFSSQKDPCLIWINDWVVKNIKNNFKQNTDYQFIIKLDEPNTAHFKHKVYTDGKNWENNMILKNKEYFKNTVQKIGFWDKEDYFYEVNQKQNLPSQKIKMSGLIFTMICLLFLIPTLLFLGLIKWISKRKN